MHYPLCFSSSCSPLGPISLGAGVHADRAHRPEREGRACTRTTRGKAELWSAQHQTATSAPSVSLELPSWEFCTGKGMRGGEEIIVPRSWEENNSWGSG